MSKPVALPNDAERGTCMRGAALARSLGEDPVTELLGPPKKNEARSRPELPGKRIAGLKSERE